MQFRRPGFDPWVWKIPWRREWQHSSIPAWKIPRAEESGGLYSMGSQRVRHDWVTHLRKRTSILTANKSWFVVVVVELLHYVRLFAAPWTAACQTSLSFTISWSVLQFMSIELVMLSNHLILCHPLLLLPSIFPSIRVLSSESDLRIRWQSTGAAASTSVLPMNIQGWFPLGLTSLVSLQSKGVSRVFTSTTVQKHHFLGAQPFLSSNSHIRTWQLEFEHSLSLPFFGIGMKTYLFQFYGHCWVFQICWHIECGTSTASFFSIWNTARIPSPPLAVLVMLLQSWLLVPFSVSQLLLRWTCHPVFCCTLIHRNDKVANDMVSKPHLVSIQLSHVTQFKCHWFGSCQSLRRALSFWLGHLFKCWQREPGQGTGDSPSSQPHHLLWPSLQHEVTLAPSRMLPVAWDAVPPGTYHLEADTQMTRRWWVRCKQLYFFAELSHAFALLSNESQ